MTVEELKASIEAGGEPSRDLPPLIRALWYERSGNWKRAHEITQDIEGPEAAWVHAYLHRREGDLGNARYWYRRADRAESQSELGEEWEEIAACLLAAM